MLNSFITGSVVYSIFCTSSWLKNILQFLVTKPAPLFVLLPACVRIAAEHAVLKPLLLTGCSKSVAPVHRLLSQICTKYTRQSVVCLIYKEALYVGLYENHFQLVLAISFSFCLFRSLIFCKQQSFKRR